MSRSFFGAASRVSSENSRGGKNPPLAKSSSAFAHCIPTRLVVPEGPGDYREPEGLKGGARKDNHTPPRQQGRRDTGTGNCPKTHRAVTTQVTSSPPRSIWKNSWKESYRLHPTKSPALLGSLPQHQPCISISWLLRRCETLARASLAQQGQTISSRFARVRRSTCPPSLLVSQFPPEETMLQT
jgi:hypothetical protein